MRCSFLLAVCAFACQAKPPEPAPEPLAAAAAMQPVALKLRTCAYERAPASLDVASVPNLGFASAPTGSVIDIPGEDEPLVLRRVETASLTFFADEDIDPAWLDCAAQAAEDAWSFVTGQLGPFLLAPRPTIIVVMKAFTPEAVHAVAKTSSAFPAFFVAPQSVYSFYFATDHYVEALALLTHELTHFAQSRLPAAETTALFSEGEAQLMAALAVDAVLPGSSAELFDADADRLAASFEGGVTLEAMLAQSAHQYHDEVSLFALAAEGTTPRDWRRAREVLPVDGALHTIESGWRQAVGRPFVDPRWTDELVDARVIRGLVRRPEIPPGPPTITPLYSDFTDTRHPSGADWSFRCVKLVATGFAPGEVITVDLPGGEKKPLAVDHRGAGVVSTCEIPGN